VLPLITLDRLALVVVEPLHSPVTLSPPSDSDIIRISVEHSVHRHFGHNVEWFVDSESIVSILGVFLLLMNVLNCPHLG